MFIASDILNNPITFEYEEIRGQTDRLSEKIKSLSEILVPSYAQSEVEFARKKPEDVPNDFMLKSLAPLLDEKTNDIDWSLFQQKTENLLRQFFVTMDWKASSGAQDIHIFVVARNKETDKALGVIQFMITPDIEKRIGKSRVVRRYSFCTGSWFGKTAYELNF